MQDDDSIDRRIDFAKFILGHNQDIINLVDTKAGVLLAVDGAILALLTAMPVQSGSMIVRTVMVLTVVAVGLSALCGFLTIVPRTARPSPASQIFFRSIVSKSRDQHMEGFNPSPEEILQDYLENIYSLALIQKKKFAYLSISLYCLTLGLIPLSVLVIFTHV